MNPPTGMALGIILRASLSSQLCSSNRKGSLPYYFYYRSSEREAPVRIGIRGRIVAIEVHRAGIVAIVRIAETISTAKTAREGSTCLKSTAKVHIISVFQQVKERIL